MAHNIRDYLLDNIQQCLFNDRVYRHSTNCRHGVQWPHISRFGDVEV